MPFCCVVKRMWVTLGRRRIKEVKLLVARNVQILVRASRRRNWAPSTDRRCTCHLPALLLCFHRELRILLSSSSSLSTQTIGFPSPKIRLVPRDQLCIVLCWVHAAHLPRWGTPWSASLAWATWERCTPAALVMQAGSEYDRDDLRHHLRNTPPMVRFALFFSNPTTTTSPHLQ